METTGSIRVTLGGGRAVLVCRMRVWWEPRENQGETANFNVRLWLQREKR